MTTFDLKLNFCQNCARVKNVDTNVYLTDLVDGVTKI